MNNETKLNFIISNVKLKNIKNCRTNRVKKIHSHNISSFVTSFNLSPLIWRKSVKEVKKKKRLYSCGAIFNLCIRKKHAKSSKQLQFSSGHFLDIVVFSLSCYLTTGKEVFQKKPFGLAIVQRRELITRQLVPRPQNRLQLFNGCFSYDPL